MIGLSLEPGALVLAVAAHPDDIEVGAGATLLQLAERHPDLSFCFAVASGTPDRVEEALASAQQLLGDRVTLRSGGFRDGFLPYDSPSAAKEWLAESPDPDLVFAPWRDDFHQDHAFLGQLAWQVFRRRPIFEYEVPKWEGERFVPNLLMPVPDEYVVRKLDHLNAHFSSQHDKPWYDASVFRSVLRLRGMQHGGCEHAEGFLARKLALGVFPPTDVNG